MNKTTKHEIRVVTFVLTFKVSFIRAAAAVETFGCGSENANLF